MIFTRHSADSPYFLPSGPDAGANVFVFSNRNDAQFSLQKAFAGTQTDKFLLIVHKVPVDFSSAVEVDLRAALGNKSRILWLDDFSNGVVQRSSSIFITNAHELDRNDLSLSIGTNNVTTGVRNQSIKGGFVYDPQRKELRIKPAGAGAFAVRANMLQTQTKEIIIPLSNAAPVVSGHSLQPGNVVGGACFEILRSESSLPQPVSPFLARQEEGFPESKMILNCGIL